MLLKHLTDLEHRKTEGKQHIFSNISNKSIESLKIVGVQLIRLDKM